MGAWEQSMKQQIGLGSIVGLVAGLLCWRGNQAPQLVSVFPDALTFAALTALLSVAVGVVVVRSQPRGQPVSVRASVTVGAAAGVTFGLAVVGLGFHRLTNPTPMFLSLGFFTALGSAVACAVGAAFVVMKFSRVRVA